MTINGRRDQHFAALCKVLGVPELAVDPRYATPAGRLANEAALMTVLRERVKAWPMKELEAALVAADVLHAPVNDYRRYFDDAHVQATGAIAWVDHPQVGRIPLPRVPGVAQPTAGSAAGRSPLVGEHTREVLAELGLDAAAIAALEASGTVRTATAAAATASGSAASC
jgi:crotonobetainyl-CoA:carnitine CoA-transferase CaiB-like acyl-CoA transferase